MKKIILFSAIFISVFASLTFTSCLKDKCVSSKNYISYTPIYKTLEAIRAEGISMLPARELKKTGKIYSYKNYLIINELREGLHIIDNQNPSNPLPVGFLKISGNIDMAIKGDILYADNFTDLLAIDLSNILQPKIESRQINIFLPLGVAGDPSLGIITGYDEKTVSVPCNSPSYYYEGQVAFFSIDDASFNSIGSINSSVPSAISGIGGSQARFTLYDTYLYAVDNTSLQTFNIANLKAPVFMSRTQVGFGIETIFPYKNRLFIGSTTGMFIFDNSNPSAPRQLSQFTHARACDPVFATENRAYVTLHVGDCGGVRNQLDVIDISNLNSPTLIKSYQMNSPKGLSVSENKLFLCDAGLKVFDVSNDSNIDNELLSHWTGANTYDVIALESRKIILVVGENGLFQFDYQDANNLKLLSKMEVKK